jgi:hypothetical protein
VLLDADGPDDYERAVRAFQHDHEAAIEEFVGHLARKLREIMLVEFTCEKIVDREGHGPRCTMLVAERLADARAWELGERTQVDMHTALGRSGLETLDTLIMAGIADTRAEAIGWALAASASGQHMSGSASGSGRSINSGTSSETRPGHRRARYLCSTTFNSRSIAGASRVKRGHGVAYQAEPDVPPPFAAALRVQCRDRQRLPRLSEVAMKERGRSNEGAEVSPADPPISFRRLPPRTVAATLTDCRHLLGGAPKGSGGDGHENRHYRGIDRRMRGSGALASGRTRRNRL